MTKQNNQGYFTPKLLPRNFALTKVSRDVQGFLELQFFYETHKLLHNYFLKVITTLDEIYPAEEVLNKYREAIPLLIRVKNKAFFKSKQL